MQGCVLIEQWDENTNKNKLRNGDEFNANRVKSTMKNSVYIQCNPIHVYGRKKEQFVNAYIKDFVYCLSLSLSLVA